MFQVTATAIEIGKTHVSLSVYLLPILYVNNLPQQHIRGMTSQVPSYLTQLLTFSTPNFFLFVLVLDNRGLKYYECGAECPCQGRNV